jgi:hypothetical protein
LTSKEPGYFGLFCLDFGHMIYFLLFKIALVGGLVEFLWLISGRIKPDSVVALTLDDNKQIEFNNIEHVDIG